MKTLRKIATVALILGTSSLLASNLNSRVITNNYKLLNDMNFAKKQKSLIVDMSKALETNHVDIDAYKKFTKVLLGLVKGDESLHLRGTDISEIKATLTDIQKLWRDELSILSDAKSDRDIEKAMELLNRVSFKIDKVVSLYNKSYDRFRQKSKISFIVKQQMIASEKPLLAYYSK